MGRSVLPSILKFVLPPPPPPTPPPPTSSKANERAQSYRDVWGKKPVAPSAQLPELSVSGPPGGGEEEDFLGFGVSGMPVVQLADIFCAVRPCVPVLLESLSNAIPQAFTTAVST